MNVSGHHRNWVVESEAELYAVLQARDERGGAEFWLGAAEENSKRRLLLDMALLSTVKLV